VELAFVPLIASLVVVDVVARSDRQLSAVAKLTGAVQALVGFAVLAYVVSHAFSDLQSLGSLDTLRSVILPPLLSILLSPFVYITVLEARYESLFVNLNVGEEKSRELKRYAKRRIVMHCRLSLRKVEGLLKGSGSKLMGVKEEADIDRILQPEMKP